MKEKIKEIPVDGVAPSQDECTEKGNNPETANIDMEELGDATDGNPQNEGQEHTRSKMALLFVLGFFSILFLCFLYAIMVRASLNELKETLTAVVGALSGILGFIVGYYYKSAQEK